MKKDITYTIKPFGIDYSDLIPRHIDNYKVIQLNEDGYAVYNNNDIVYLSSDPYEASNEFDNLVYLDSE